MINNLILAAVLVLCFLFCVYSYILGVKHGRIVRDGGTPHLPNPVKAVEEIAEKAAAKKEQKEVEDDLAAVMSLSKESMIKAIDLERGQRKGVVR